MLNVLYLKLLIQFAAVTIKHRQVERAKICIKAEEKNVILYLKNIPESILRETDLKPFSVNCRL